MPSNALKNDIFAYNTWHRSLLAAHKCDAKLAGGSLRQSWKSTLLATISFFLFFGRGYTMIQRQVKNAWKFLAVNENANLERQVVPVDNSSNCVTTSHNVSVTEVFLYFSSFWPFFAETKPIHDKVKELVGSVALSEFLRPLHFQVGVQLHDPNVLVIVVTIRILYRAKSCRIFSKTWSSSGHLSDQAVLATT